MPPEKGSTTALPENFEARIATTETRIDAVANDVGRVAATVERLSKTIEAGFSNLHDRITAQQRTNWPTIFGGFVVVATIFAVYLQGPINTLQRTESRQDTMLDRELVNSYHRGRADESRDTNRAELLNLRAENRELLKHLDWERGAQEAKKN